MLFLCWRQVEWLTWGRVLSGILTYIVTYVNISSPPVMGPTMDRAALPKLQGTEPLCPLSWAMTVTQVWGQAPRFTTTPSGDWDPQSSEAAPHPTLPSPAGALQGATISLEFTRGRKPHRSMAGAHCLSDTFLPHHSRLPGVEHTAGRHLAAHGFAV